MDFPVEISEEDKKKFTCIICKRIFENPVVALCCRETLCAQCLIERRRVEKFCPKCSFYLEDDKIVPAPRMLLEIIEVFKQACKYKKYGCDAILLLSDWDSHIAHCQYKVKFCKLCFAKNDTNGYFCYGCNLLEQFDSVEKTIRVYVKRMGIEKEIEIPANELYTVRVIKKRLLDMEEIPMDQYRLIFKGEQLEDERTFKDYGIENESTIFLVFKLRGGFKSTLDNCLEENIKALEYLRCLRKLGHEKAYDLTEIQNSGGILKNVRDFCSIS
jgi:hypothetical protein